MEATFISNNTFSVEGDRTSEFIEKRRVKLDCGTDGVFYAAVVSSSFDSVDTQVSIDESVLTSNLIDVLYSSVRPGITGNLPNHTHSSTEGDGGVIDISTVASFSDLTDTPSTYSGTLGQYAMSTGSGVVWSTVSGTAGEGGSSTFLGLTDTPDTYPPLASIQSFKLTITAADINDNLTDFPVMLQLSSMSGKDYYDTTKIFDDIAGQFKKLKVTDINGDQLYVEVENWDEVAKEASLHVKVPLISSSKDTILTLEWDNNFSETNPYVGVTGSSEAQNVWNSDYSGVYNLNQNPTGGSPNNMFDSTSFSRHGTSNGGMDASDIVDGPYGKGLTFDQSDDYISTPSRSLTTNHTVEVYAKPTGTQRVYTETTGGTSAVSYAAQNRGVVAAPVIGDSSRGLGMMLGTNAIVAVMHGPSYYPTPIVYTGSFEGPTYSVFQTTSNNIKLFVNGGYKDQWTSPDPVNISHNIGTCSYGKFGGEIYTVRFSDVPRSDEWIAVTYKTLSDNLITFSSGAEKATDKILKLNTTGDGLEWMSLDSSNFGVSDFISLADTPTTYSGTNDKYLKSTGSGIVWTELANSTVSGINNLYSDNGDPTAGLGEINDHYISITSDSIFKKNRLAVPIDFSNDSVKSVVFDFADNWGNTSELYMLLRSVEFYNNSTLIPLTKSDFTAYATTYSIDPWDFEPANVFVTGLTKVGYWNQAYDDGNSWSSTNGNNTNQRVIIVFNTPRIFDEIVVNNAHHNGGYTDCGVKNTKIYASASEITDVTYGSVVEDSILLFDGVFSQHPASNTVDDQTLVLTPPDVNDTGWDVIVEGGISSFTELTDTPSTYSGTEGLYARSTGSGIVWEVAQASVSGSVFTVGTTTPTNEDADYYIHTEENSIYRKTAGVDSSSTKLLIHSNTTDGSLDIIDSSDYSHQINLANQVQHSTTQQKFGTSSIYFDGSGDHFSIDASTDFLMGEGYTFDFWVYRINQGVQHTLFNAWQNYNDTDNWYFYINSSNKLAFYPQGYQNTSGPHIIGTTDILSGNWYHVAASYDGMTCRIFVNGNLDAQQAVTCYGNSDQNPVFGLNSSDFSSQPLNGYIDEIRFTKGEALWTSSFTPDTEPYDFSDTWDLVLSGSTTSSGTTTSGTTIITESRAPLTSDGNIGDFFVDTSDEVMYEKTSVGGVPTASQAKSVILDIADNWGDPSNVGLRSVEFKYQGTLITNPNPTAYDTTHYTQGGYADDTWAAIRIFDTDLSKTGDNIGTGWYSVTGTPSNQRVIVVFDSPTVFDEIVVNNAHHVGNADVDMGARNVKIYISTDTITDTTYNATISNSTLIFDGEFPMHPQADVIDDQVLTLTGGNYAVNNGWESILAGGGSKDFIGLIDTPVTYSGTEGQFAKSTGLGIVWDNPPNNLTAGSGAPSTTPTSDIFYLDTQDEELYTTIVVGNTSTKDVKSVIFDCATTWGATDYMSINVVEFKLDGTLILNPTPTVYQTTAYNANYVAAWAFDTDVDKNLSWGNDCSWVTTENTVTNQRVVVVFDTLTTFDEIVINNGHLNGTKTNTGVQDVKIYTSTDTITDTTFDAPISNSTKIYDGKFREHVAANQIDDESFPFVVAGDLSWASYIQNKKNFTDLIDTPSTYSGTQGYYLKSTGSGIDFVGGSATGVNWYFGSEVPTANAPAAASPSDLYYQENNGKVYRRQDNTGHLTLLEDSFVGTSLDTNKWDTRLVPASSVTVDGYLQLNNHTGDAHSGAYAYSVNSFQTEGKTKLTCKWKPHTDHYASAHRPSICFRHPSSYSPDGTYGIASSNCIVLLLCNGSDTTNRTLLEIREGSSAVASVGIDIDESLWHDLTITMDWETNLFSVDLNSTYTVERTVTQSLLDNIGSSFVLEFGTADYNKENTEAFDDVSLLLLDANVGVWQEETNFWPTTSGITEFLGLTDTPTTYSGTSGKYAQSTGSGIVWSTVPSWYTGTDNPTDFGKPGDFYIDTDSDIIYKKATDSSNNPNSNTGTVLIHSDTTNGSISFTDSSGNNHSITRGGDVQHSTEQSKFGTSSIKFDGNGDFLNLGNHVDWNMGTSDFTIDFWMYASSNADEKDMLVSVLTNATSDNEFCISLGTMNWSSPGNHICLSIHYGGSSWLYEGEGTTNVCDSTWHHVALVRNGTSWVVYVDGSPEISTTTSFNPQAGSLLIGSHIIADRFFNGYMDEFRLMKGTVGWESNFTPNSEAYPVIDPAWQTVLNSSDTFLDLIDTPTTYSGGQYLRTTTSGIEAVDGIILTAPDGGEWKIIVDNSGNLSTTPV